jgi:hypothetical protein
MTVTYTIDWSATWAGVSAVAACLTFFVALAAALAALRQLRQARELSEEQARPYVLVVLEPSEASNKLVDLVVKNIGSTAARQVKLTLTPEFERVSPTAGYPFMATKFIRDGIALLPPAAEYRTLFESIPEHRSSGRTQSEFTVRVSYLDRLSRPISDEFVLDLNANEGSLFVDVHNMHHIAKTLRAIAKDKGIRNF